MNRDECFRSCLMRKLFTDVGNVTKCSDKLLFIKCLEFKKEIYEFVILSFGTHADEIVHHQKVKRKID